MTGDYNPAVVRKLLQAAFTADELRRFCQDRPLFGPVLVGIPTRASLNEMADAVIRYCETNRLFDDLCTAIKEANPRQYERFEPNLHSPYEPPARPSGLRLSAPMQAPPLPPHFVPRAEVSELLKARLLAEEECAPGVLVISAIQGLGGIGKSVLAAALAHDPEIRALFPDGVLWATIGQEPETLSLLIGWIRDGLRDFEYQPLRIEDASLHLRTLLQDKACLLVVDDVWCATAARPFLAGGARCRALITTRRADVADELGAKLFCLDVMTKDQSLALFGARLGRLLVGEERAEALRLARAVDHLPLALELAAARVARGVAWDELYDALAAEAAHIESLESARDRRGRSRLEAAFRLSLASLQAEDPAAWEAFIWLGVLPEDVRVSAPAAAMLWGVTDIDADDLLELLWSEALLLPGAPVFIGRQTWRAYRLHDLMRAFARRLLEAPVPNGLGIALPQAHSTILDHYRAQTHNGQWHMLPDDGYIHNHLAWHMEQAGRGADIHALLREETVARSNAWYEARERLGQAGGYLVDVSRAWDLAQSQAAGAALACRYALIVASFNSLAANIPPELLIALIDEGIWTPSQGLAYARRVPLTWKRALALAQLGPHLPEGLRAEALKDSVITARAISDPKDRVQTLVALTPYLPAGQQAEALEHALVMVSAIRREDDCAGVLLELAPHLPSRLLGGVVAIVRAFRDDRLRARTLVRLVPHLPPDQRTETLKEELTAARNVRDESLRADLLVELTPHLPKELLPDAITAARSIEFYGWRGEALAGLGPYLPDWQRTEILEDALSTTVPSIEAGLYHMEMLAKLSAHLTAELLGQAIVIFRTIKYGRNRAGALVGLVPHLSEAQRAEILVEVLTIAQNVCDEEDCAAVLVELAPHLSRELLAEAISTARTIEHSQYRMEALVGLAQHVPEQQRTDVIREALSAAQNIEDEWDRAKALLGLTPRLPPELLGEMLVVAVRTIKEEEYRAKVLVRIAPQLPERQRAQGLREALTAVGTIMVPADHKELLVELAPHLPEELLSEALAQVRTNQVEPYRSTALAGLVRHLPARLLHEALTIARTIGDKDPQARVLTTIAPHLATGRMREALGATRAIWPESDRASALERLGPYLPGELLGEALTLVLTIEDEGSRATALAGLGPYLPLELIATALAAARAIKSEYWRSKALGGLGGYLPEGQREEVVAEALAAARSVKFERGSAQALVTLSCLLPEEVKAEMLKEALTSVQAIEDEEARAAELNRLRHHIPEELLTEVLATARAIRYGTARDWALVGRWGGWVSKGLLGEVLSRPELHLSEELLAELFAAVRSICSIDDRAEALARLALRLPDEQQVEALGEALALAGAIADQTWRAQALAKLAPHLAEVQRTAVLKEALNAARAVGDEEIRTELLTRLAPHLSEDQCAEVLKEALAAIRAMPIAGLRGSALMRLGSRLPEEVLEEAVTMALTLQFARAHAVALAGLVDAIIALPRASINRLWLEILNGLAARTREDFLYALTGLTPVAAILGGAQAVDELFSAVEDIGRWWP